jgi:hypothetical protein
LQSEFGHEREHFGIDSQELDQFLDIPIDEINWNRAVVSGTVVIGMAIAIFLLIVFLPLPSLIPSMLSLPIAI